MTEQNASMIPKHCKHHFASGPHTFGHFWSCGTEAFLFHVCTFLSPGHSDEPMSSPLTMHSRNSWPLKEYHCKNDRAQAHHFLWSYIGACTHCAHTLLNPRSWMIMTAVLCDRFKSCFSSLSVILLFLLITFSMSKQLLAVLAATVCSSLYWLFHLAILHAISLYCANS